MPRTSSTLRRMADLAERLEADGISIISFSSGAVVPYLHVMADTVPPDMLARAETTRPGTEYLEHRAIENGIRVIWLTENKNELL